jgi:GT2 family glycosyltransferase
MISLIIPATSKNHEYTDNIVSNIRSLYPNESEVEIIVETNDSVTLGENYNNAVARATGEKIILLHNDMIIPKGFIELMDKHIIDNRITTYTRIEPPIYTDIYPGKRILDCGSDLSSFNLEKFNQIQITEQLEDGGSQLFFGCMKKDYIGIDGKTFKMFCEDDDLHRRYKLLGYEHKVSSAFVYHFVSKTSRSDSSYQQIELQSNRNFIRKWGTRNFLSPKYNIAFRVENCSQELLSLLEPWCDRIYSDAEWMKYVTLEQPNTKFNLRQRCHGLTDLDRYDYDDIIVEINGNRFTQQDYEIIQKLSAIIQDSGEPGLFELSNLKITIVSINDQKNELIICM